MSIADKDFLPWVKLSSDRLEKELLAKQQFVPADKAHYPLQLNIKKVSKTVTDEVKERVRKFIPGKVFFPLDVDSSLTKSQQAVCLKVLQMYRSERDFNNLTKIEQENLDVYKKLHSVILEEHAKFSEYVKKDWQKKSDRLENMKNRLFAYTKTLWEKKLEKVIRYPSHYKLHDTICLAYEDPDNHIQVCMQENVHNSGTSKTVILPTLTSKCILSFRNLPSIENYELNSQMPVVSQDGNIVDLLKTNNVDVVLSMSALKRLMDDSNPHCFWNIPVIVRKHKVVLPDGNEQFKKFVFLDKALPMQYPTKFEFSEKCHKELVRTNFSRVFTNSEESNKLNQNVVYNIWNISFNDKENVLMKTKKLNRKINFLLRQKIDGFESLADGKTRPVVLLPKVEYQLEHGANIATKTELVKQWTDLLFRPFSHLYRVRLQGNTSEVVDVESVSLQKINSEAMHHHQYKPFERLGALFTVFTKLLDLECGNYMLHHNERTGAFAEVLIECINTEQNIKLDLTKAYDSNSCCVKVHKNRAWCPIDVNYILPAHATFKRMPGMFKPAVVVYNNKKGVKKKKKGKKRLKPTTGKFP
ncbi:hypothetical protein RN001_012857 [Aquatica leii]|uniref:Little elongation complex subunit 2 C-terminal domain-containing protein n=1 Tax=Aquatica leii TaxID=1421715 RepID=A0AAN7SPN9_9COLE|nr:hypothetical protein RN001_012857 [Aquatica leii]